jgi:uncharacterized protein YjbJ (UPF0337 family)
MTAGKRSPRAGAPAAEKAVAAREARGSVHEAIGKLIGDDAACAYGHAEKHAGAADTATAEPTPSRDRPRKP